MAATSTLPAKLIQISGTDVFQPDGTALEEVLQEIETHARAVVLDVSTAKGRKEIASLANRVARSKTYLDQLGKDLVADLKKKAGAVDAQRRTVRERLDALKGEVRRPLTELEEAEAARQQAELRAIRDWQDQHQLAQEIDPEHTELAEIRAEIERIERIELDPALGDRLAEAQSIRDATLYRLGQCEKRRLQVEEERARIKAEEEAERQRERELYAKTMAEEAAAKARRDAEEQARLKIEEERQRAAQQQAAAVAKARAEAEAAAKDEAQSAPADTPAPLVDREQKRATNRAAAAALAQLSGLSNTDAEAIIRWIALDQVPGVRMDYSRAID